MSRSANVENVFRLTESQQTLLLHRLQRGPADTGLLVLRALIAGELDTNRFRKAWEATVARHEMLRCSVHWDGLSHPVQVISRRVEFTIRHEDWRDVPPCDQERRLDDLETEYRHRGLDVTVAPVLQLALLRLSDRKHCLLWACHHILIDGWSSALVLGEVLDRYRCSAQRKPHSPPPSRKFAEYAAWARKQGKLDA